MTPVPEPHSDLLAQLAAVLDPAHPKVAMLLVPGNENEIPVSLVGSACVVSRPEGTLITCDAARAAAFKRGPVDAPLMARILGYPEDKDEVVRRCEVTGDASQVRAVQARNAQGAVITEAFASYAGLQPTIRALAEHVPLGGELVVLWARESILRRVSRRFAEGMS